MTTMKSVSRTAVSHLSLALILCIGAAALGSASQANAAADSSSPPAPEETLKPDRGTTAQENCIDESDGYHQDGKRYTFVIRLANKCEVRFRCEVFGYSISAKGPSSGRATLILAPKSHGAAARQSYAMKVRLASGSTHVARECRMI